MVKQRSPRAGPAERSSNCHTLPEDIASSRIALPIILLAFCFIILVHLSSILSAQVPSTHPPQLHKDPFLHRNYRQDRFNLRLTKKTDNHRNRSVLALHYLIFTPQRRRKHKRPISMLGGISEREISPAKVGFFTPRDQEVCNGDNHIRNHGYIEDSGEKNLLGIPTKTRTKAGLTYKGGNSLPRRSSHQKAARRRASPACQEATAISVAPTHSIV